MSSADNPASTRPSQLAPLQASWPTPLPLCRFIASVTRFIASAVDRMAEQSGPDGLGAPDMPAGPRVGMGALLCVLIVLVGALAMLIFLFGDGLVPSP